ncbi:CYFA0S01e12970g1_1 [Cyberlindnera fabianii]|uniref:Mediator of RNA polymerase II transcription subunit 10 n=1 Tax=Cyberlindnera fabianii TaxID=36022 RepID=A0A061AQG7_CYBFA|nr:Mediator of RNA polymerase II transcription subunit 10 [Cyberlindnera fabianii]CDR37597.1 CYFA0S01e12970g1_1 [Cyberlindnera fabianii]
MAQVNNQAVEQEIEKTKQIISDLVESFIELGIIVHDFQGTESSRDALSLRLNHTIDELQKLQSPATNSLDNVPVPLDVLQYVEDGRNPDVYTREFVETTRKANQHLRGKMMAMRDLRDVLGKKIASEFPELGDVVQDIIKRTDG